MDAKKPGIGRHPPSNGFLPRGSFLYQLMETDEGPEGPSVILPTIWTHFMLDSEAFGE